MPSLGACDAKSFVPYCKPYEGSSTHGSLVVCQRGQQLESGGPCEPEKR